MSVDHDTYRRAAVAAIIGLTIQLLASIVIAMFGLYAESSAIYAATWHAFGGIPIWLILWMLYNQHRLERLESLETEQLARSDARAAALFDESGQMLAMARKRLENLYKYGINSVSALVSLYLILSGSLLFYSQYRLIRSGLIEQAALGQNVNAGLLAILFLGVAFLAFLVARYVAGMTIKSEWQLLRGGAGYLMGNVIVLLLLMIASIFAYFDKYFAYSAAALLVPSLMGLLGIEIGLGFLLGLYRPRRPGEVPRPAFDSRLLGWLTSPQSIGRIISETLNYQFGFEISRSWFYLLLGKAITPLLIIGAMVLISMTSVVIVSPHEKAIVTRWGEYIDIAEPGLSFKWPWPMGRIEKHEVYRVHQISVGSKDSTFLDRPILWTNQHTEGKEQYMVIATTPLLGEAGDSDSTAGELAGVEVVVKYRIENLQFYAVVAEQPEEILQAIAERHVSRYLATHNIDVLLTTGRLEAGEQLHSSIQQDVNNERLGLEVVFAGISSIHPPQEAEVAAMFHEQIGALQEKEIAIEQASREAVSILAKVAGSREHALQISEAINRQAELQREMDQLLGQEEYDADRAGRIRMELIQQGMIIENLFDEAGGEAAQLIADAKAYRWWRALTEQARADRFIAELAAYEQAPDYYRMRRYLDTLSNVLADRRKIIMDVKQDQPPTFRFQLEDDATGLESILEME